MPAALLVVGLLSSCDANERQAGPEPSQTPATTAASSSQPPSNTMTLTRKTAGASAEPTPCPNVSGKASATDGVLSVGSFQNYLLGPQRPGSPIRKLWVASQRGGRGEAVIVVTAPTGDRASQTRKRHAFVRGLEQFYPGVIQAPVAGTYRIDVTVGRDTMCVKVDYRA